jgi:hypothetical protein
MRKSFTLIEALIVIVIMGILATITTEVLIKVYKNYYITKAYNRLTYETDLVLNEIASKLSFRVPNSVIADKCDVANGSCALGNITSFNALSSISYNDLKYYHVLEWLGKDVYSKRGMWYDALKEVVPGYSGFVDLKKTSVDGNDTYDIYTPFSDFNFVEEIDGNWTKQFGFGGNVFDNEYEVLIFSGPDNRGDISDINDSYGYWGHPANRLFKIIRSKSVFASPTQETKLHIKAISESNSTTVYEGYFLVNSAYAIVPVCENGNCSEYSLYLRYNYFPWRGQTYVNGNSTLLAKHVTEFKFRSENGVLRIYLCIDAPKVTIDGKPINVCKEKVVF